MKFTCSKESLIKILGIAENVITVKNNISILSNVLLEVSDSKLKVSACETALNFHGEIGVDVEEEGSLAVYSNRLFSIVKKMPSTEIEINTEEDGTLNIQPKGNSKIKYSLRTVDASNFPEVKSSEDVEYFSINQEVFTDMVNKTKFSISTGESRRFVSGILIEYVDNSLRMVSTDGKRLSKIEKEVTINSNVELKNIIVPIKILLETMKLCDNNGDIQLSFDDKYIYVKIDNNYFNSTLLEANFPPYEKVIPKDNDKQLLLDRKLFHETIDRISLLGDKESHKIILNFSIGNLNIFTENMALGTGEEILEVDYAYEPMKISLNYTYILDVLNVLKKDNIILEFKDPQSTIIMKEEDNEDYIYIMMPMTS